MSVATKSPSNDVAVEFAGVAADNQGICMNATQAKNVIQELARALARMAAREDDAAENGGCP